MNETVVVVNLQKTILLLGCLELQSDHTFNLLVHQLSIFEHPIFILLDDHDDVFTFVVTTPHILDGLQ